jgi:hypothetical protein
MRKIGELPPSGSLWYGDNPRRKPRIEIADAVE